MAQAPKTIRTLGDRRFAWHYVTHAGEREMQFLEKKFNFSSLELRDCMPPLQRPKLIVRETYLFLILNIPVVHRESKRLQSIELDIFIKKGSVVVVCDEPITALENFFAVLDTNPVYQRTMFASPGVFFEQLLDEIFDECFPILLQISNDIEALNNSVLNDFTHDTLQEIMRLKHNIVAFQKAIQPNRDLLTRIEPFLRQYLCTDTRGCPTLARLISHTKEIWDNLDMYNQAVDAMQSIHMNAVSLRLNETVKTLTVYSIWLAVMGAIGGFFGMGITDTPFAGRPNGFWMVMIIAGIASAIVLTIFKRKRWL